MATLSDFYNRKNITTSLNLNISPTELIFTTSPIANNSSENVSKTVPRLAIFYEVMSDTNCDIKIYSEYINSGNNNIIYQNSLTANTPINLGEILFNSSKLTDEIQMEVTNTSGAISIINITLKVIPFSPLIQEFILGGWSP